MVYPDGGPNLTLPQKLMRTHVLRLQAHTLARSLPQQAGWHGWQAGQVNGAMIIMTLATMSCGSGAALRLRFKAAAGMQNSTYKFEMCRCLALQ